MIRVLTAVLLIFAAQVSQAQVWVRVNQVGFSPTGRKTAIVFGKEPLPTEFRVLDAASIRQRVFQSLRGVSIKEPDSFAPFQDDRAVYHDDVNDYSSNEPTMDGTAAAILLWVVR